jgi:hypothetical protein
MPDEILSARRLNRALLARQLLLERSAAPIDEVVSRIGGLQAQYAPSAYVGLWTRLSDFSRSDLTAALEDRSLIQATLMRVTIHVVARGDFWPFAMGVRQARRTWAMRVSRDGRTEDDRRTEADELREALAAGPRWIRELGDAGTGFVGDLGLWVDLVRATPSGTWERRRADRLALADQWVGPCDVTEADGLRALVTSYLGAFGPAAWADIASWAGIPVAQARAAGRDLSLERFRDEAGRELVDLPGAPLPEAATPAPVRFLPHWDATLLVHARRTGILPEAYRPRVFSSRNPFSVGTYLVDGHVAGAWSFRDGTISLEPFEDLSAATQREVERERQALEAFHRCPGCRAPAPSVLLPGDRLTELGLRHGRATLHAEARGAVVQLVLRAARDVDPTCRGRVTVPRLRAALGRAVVRRTLLVLRFPVIADLLERVLERRIRGAMGPFALAVRLDRAVVRLRPRALRLLRGAFQRPRQIIHARHRPPRLRPLIVRRPDRSSADVRVRCIAGACQRVSLRRRSARPATSMTAPHTRKPMS